MGWPVVGRISQTRNMMSRIPPIANLIVDVDGQLNSSRVVIVTSMFKWARHVVGMPC